MRQIHTRLRLCLMGKNYKRKNHHYDNQPCSSHANRKTNQSIPKLIKMSSYKVLFNNKNKQRGCQINY